MSAEEIENQLAQDESVIIEIHHHLTALCQKIKQARRNGLTISLDTEDNLPVITGYRPRSFQYRVTSEEFTVLPTAGLTIPVPVEYITQEEAKFMGLGSTLRNYIITE